MIRPSFTCRIGAFVLVALCAIAPLRGQVAGTTSMLVVVDDSAPNPFGRYLPEMLRMEGLTDFTVATRASLSAPQLAGARLVLLAEMPLTAPEATLLTDYVAGGGRLIAMRPDAQLAPALGLAPAGTTATDGYLLIDPAGPGAGLQSVTLPFRGTADHYTLAGATEVAALYSTRTTAAGRPAVVRYNRTAAWTFDLARSTAFTRQGDPALAGLDRDGLPTLRTNDIFYQNIDLERANVPHADVHIRLLGRLIAALLADTQPTPQLWYFPGTAKTMLIPTADAHANLPSQYASLIDLVESHGASLSIYVANQSTLTGADITTWKAHGHDVGMHPYFSVAGQTFQEGYDSSEQAFLTTLAPHLPGPTVRHHTVEWSGWTDPVSVMAAHGIRMDTSFYSWGPAMFNPTVLSQAHGFITGSGLPMRFVDASGAVQPVYQQATTLIDEQLLVGSESEQLSTAAALAVSQQLIDDSLAGGYSALTAQFHVDYNGYDYVAPWIDGTLAYAASRNVPMWSAARWLAYVEARAATAITDVSWNDALGHLSFNVAVPAGAEAQTVLLPRTVSGEVLSAVTVDGQAVPFSAFSVNGQSTRALQIAPLPDGSARVVHATYGPLPTLAISDISAVEGHAGTSTATLTVTLSAPALDTVTANWSTADGSAVAGSDYVAASGVVTFPPGSTSQSVSVTVIGDVRDELDETVTVTLSGAANATLADGTAVLTITDDDPLPALTIGDASIVEGDAGTVMAVFPVTLTPASGLDVSVAYATAGGTAASGADFTPTSGSLTLLAGTTSGSIAVPVLGDILFEPDETFTVALAAPVNAVIADAAATGTVVNDDVLPTAVADSYATPFGVPLVVPAPGVLANDVNDGGGAMSATLISGVAHGTVTLAPGGGFTYAAASGYYGIDAFTYRVSDGSGAGNTVTATIAVGLPPPVAVADSFTTPFETTLDVAAPGVLGNDATYGAPGTAATLVTGPASGTLTLAPTGGLHYVPAPDFVGVVGFTYRVTTAAGASAAVPVTLTVAAPTTLQPPKNFRVTAIVGTTATLRWSPPRHGPAPTAYRLEAGLGPGQTIAVLPTATAAPIMTVPVPPGVFYVRVRAVRPGEASAATPDILVYVGTSAVPSPPERVLGSVHGSSVDLTWMPTFRGGVPTASVVSVTGSAVVDLPVPAGEHAAFTGVPGGSYTLTLRATNAAGVSSAAPPVTLLVPDACSGAPDPPSDVLAFAIGTTITVTWDPASTGRAATGYLVEVPGVGAFPVAGRVISGAVPPGTYAFQVRATNACGASAPSPGQVLTVP